MGEMAVSEVFENWYIDIETFKCITNDITTDEVIITEERIQHIKERHNNDFLKYSHTYKMYFQCRIIYWLILKGKIPD